MTIQALPSGVIDTHVHTAPDVIPRKMDDHELVGAMRAAGYRGVVLKSHVEGTASRAQLARKYAWPEGDVFGGLPLNFSASGGLNPDAVDTALRLGARVIWMPTLSAAAQVRQMRDGFVGSALGALARTPEKGIALTEEDFRPGSTLTAICELIASAGAVLATGHLSPLEILQLVPFALRHGIRNVIVTHPELPSISLSIDDQVRLRELGPVWFERCAVVLTRDIGFEARTMVEAIETVGPESTILATDFGQAYNSTPVEGMLRFLQTLSAAGLPDDDLERMSVANPARALGLEARGG